MNPKIFKAYDIRGIYPEELNEQTIESIVKAIYTFFLSKLQKEKATIVLGKDMRMSSPALFEVAKNTLIAMGADVIDVGLVSTPSFYFSVFHYGYDCGIQVTASHNPKEYNGVKFVLNSPRGLIKIGKSTGMDIVKELALNNGPFAKEAKGTITVKNDVLGDEIENALSVVGMRQFANFKIVADPANAMGAQYIGKLFEKIPVQLIKMNFELDGSFPVHPPDPLDFNNLKDLQAMVLSEHADFGLAPDGDGDRLFFIDEKGQVVPATLITALVSRELLKNKPGAKILFDIRYILTPEKIIEENGGTYEITRVGHAFITEKMTETGAIFAGESSAHYYYASNGNAESQLATILFVMKVLTEEKKPLSEVLEKLRRSYESGEYNFKVTNAPEILNVLKEKYADGQLNTIDGIAISYPDWRFSVRTSNTEPLLRLNVEALEKKVMEDKKDEIIKLIDSLGKK